MRKSKMRIEEEGARSACPTGGKMWWIGCLLAALAAVGCLGDKQLFPETTFKEVGEDRIELTAAVTPIPGMTLPPGTRVEFENRRIKKVVLGDDTKFLGVVFPSKSELEFTALGGHLSMQRATLGGEAELEGHSFAEGDKLSVRDDGSVIWVRLVSERTFADKSYVEGSDVWFEKGKVKKSRTPEEREEEEKLEAAKQAARNAERRRMYDTCTMQCAPLTAESRARCINHCQQYR